MPKTLHVAVLEPYYGGSHAAFVDAVARNSRHRCTVVTLPARKWKWRMRGAAIWFAQEDNAWLCGDEQGPVDIILVNDMLSVADLRAFLPYEMRRVPIVCYFHENQLTYPLPTEDDRDYQYGMTNITSCLAADAVWFNSRFHLEDFLGAARLFLGKMPDCVPGSVIETIQARTAVVPPPVAARRVTRTDKRPPGSVTVIWCHRWEYDKNPKPFFGALLRLDEAGYPFDLVLVGEQFRTAPPVFADSWARLQRHVVHAGFLPSRADYSAMLCRGDVVVSTAIQENFGIGVVEAILSGCRPLLPDRLAYPELIPPDLHDACLYPSDDALLERLRDLLDGRNWLAPDAMNRMQRWIEGLCGLETGVRRLDDELNRVFGAVTGVREPS